MAPPNTPATPATQVADADPLLTSFLIDLRYPNADARPLADWLADQNDPRGSLVRELAEARCVVPSKRPTGREGCTLASGAGWSIVLRRASVVARVYAPSGVVLRMRDDVGDRPLAPEAVIYMFDTLRRKLIFGLFGLTQGRVRCLAVVLDCSFGIDFAVRMLESRPRVAEGGRKHVRGWLIPYLRQLRAANPARLGQIVARLWSSGELHQVGDDVMDAIAPGWLAKLLADCGLTGGA
jgi:hypothetical protein